MITPEMKRKLDSLDIHPTPGEKGWPQALHIPNVRGLFRAHWIVHAFPGETCGTRGCLVGHVGAAFRDGPYIDGTVPNDELGEQADDFMRLLVVRLGVDVDYLHREEGNTWGPQVYEIASNLFECGVISVDEEGDETHGWKNLDGSTSPPFPQVVEAWCDVAQYCGYVVTPALRKQLLEAA